VAGSTGDVAAIAAFCRRQHPPLVGLLGLYCGDDDLAERLAHEALVRMVDDWPRTRRNPSDARLFAIGMALADARPRGRAPAGVRRDDDEAREAVREAVVALPRRERQVLLLRLLAGCSMADTAGALGQRPVEVATLTRQGLAHLRAALGPRAGARDPGHDAVDPSEPWTEETPAPAPAWQPDEDDHELWRPPRDPAEADEHWRGPRGVAETRAADQRGAAPAPPAPRRSAEAQGG